MKREGLRIMTVNELVSSALLLYMQEGMGQELEYVSKSESSQLGWYFWLQKVPGVYEIELKGEHPETNQQGVNREEFYVRYYPAREENILETYSVAEQVIRFDACIFDDSVITANPEEHEICPCCAVSQKNNTCHYHHKSVYPTRKRRPKGIPRLLKKFVMHKELFKIGDMSIAINEETRSFRVALRTKKKLVEKAAASVSVQQDGETIELVKKGGIDRNIPGYELAARFMDFWGGKILATMAKENNIAAHSVEEVTETVSKSCLGEDEVLDIIIQCGRLTETSDEKSSRILEKR